LHDLSDRQIAELFAQAHQLVHHAFKLAHGLNLLVIEWNQRRIGKPDRYGFAGFLAGQQRIGAAFDAGTVGVFNGQELLSQRTAAQLTQVGQLAQEALTLLFEVRVAGRSGFNIVGSILQLKRQSQRKTSKQTFISSTPWNRRA
jgi:hypothetical protein